MILKVTLNVYVLLSCTLRKKRYKSCHWGCTFSKGTLLYPKAAYWYLSGTY